MKDDNQINAIIDGIIDYLKSTKSLDLLPEVAQRLTGESWIKIDPNLARVHSRIKLTSNQIQLIKTVLSQYLKRPIRVKTLIDPAIIAGIRINVSGRTIDATVNRRLEELRKKVIYD